MEYLERIISETGKYYVLEILNTREIYEYDTFLFFLYISGTDSFLLGTFLGFSLYISNTTDKSQGTLCFKDSNYSSSTIPPVVNITCPVHGQYVIYYNERLANVSYPPDYHSYNAYNFLCEVEVYGKN